MRCLTYSRVVSLVTNASSGRAGTPNSGGVGSETTPRPHTSTAFSDTYGVDDHATMRHSATLRPLEDYTNKYKGEQVEVALFGGEYQEGVLTAYCSLRTFPTSS